jgi:hypothetical protein
LKAFLVQFIPGPKALALAIAPALIWVDHYFKLGIPDAKVVAASIPIAAYIVGHFFSKPAEVKS